MNVIGILNLAHTKQFCFRYFLQGSETPGLVLVTDSMNGNYHTDLISRCINTLVIVARDSAFHDLIKDDHRIHCIQVQGNIILL